MTVHLPAPKTDFIELSPNSAYLATAGQPPLLGCHREAFEQFAHDKASGSAGYQAHWQVGHRAKALLSQMTQLPARDHAFVGSASEAIARVMSSIDWRPGDNVVVADKEYASGRFAILRLAKIGVQPRVIPSRGWYIDPQSLVDACDARTRLVYLSQVTSLTGQRFDVETLSEELTRRGARLLVDASHALGVIPVDGRLADFTVSSAYKFLCATHLGVLAWNRDRQPDFEPLSIGWASAADSPDGLSYELHDDASRAQVGNPNHLDVYLLERSLAYLLGFGIDAIERHVTKLSTRLYDAMASLGIDLVTPASAGERGANVAYADAEDVQTVERAAQDGVYLWEGGGRVRASMHLFNTEADVDRFVEWLRERL